MIQISLLSDIRFFLKKFLKNPILAAAVAYTIYVLLTRYLKKEAFAESIKVIKKSGNKAVIYDDTIKKYILVDHNKDIYSAKKPDKLLKMLGEK